MRAAFRTVSKGLFLSFALIAVSGSPIMAAGECAEKQSPKEQLGCVEAKIDKLLEPQEFKSSVLRSLNSIKIESVRHPEVCLYKDNHGVPPPYYPMLAVPNCGNTTNDAFRFRILPF